MTGILIYVGIFWVGALVGFLLKAWMDYRFTNYTGTILVTHDKEKTVYSLILDEYPDSIEFKKEVVFKVDASDVELDRNEN